ncbi:hypothetical protein Avbf_18917 [Armadillidium vulgare]|nr:hypothetical protein Avbf_18917 [Armadillidium vulgare]
MGQNQPAEVNPVEPGPSGVEVDQLAVELAPFGNIEIDGDKYPQDLSYSVSTVYCETPEEKWNPSPDIHLGKLEHWFSIFLVMSPHYNIYIYEYKYITHQYFQG